MATNTTGTNTQPTATAPTRTTGDTSLTMTSVTTPTQTTVPTDVTQSISSAVSSSILSGTTTVPPPTTVDTTSVVSASSAAPSTQLITSIVTQTPTAPGQTSVPPITVIVTSETTPTTAPPADSASTTATSSTSSPATLQNGQQGSSGSGGLSPGGRTAIAVVVPVVAVALIVLAALFFWRRRKQKKSAEEARRKEVEEYGYNPNNDPTLPAVAADGQSEMAEDHGSGYRGWGAAMSNRKPSTTLSGGHTHGQLSDAGSNPGGMSTSPTAFGGSDGQNSENYAKQRDTMSSDDLAALGAAPAASQNRNDMRRGPSNASSSYSAGHRSDVSDPSIGQRAPSDGPGSPQNYAYNQHGPYGDGSYGGGDGMPVVRDVSARRNTRIEQGGGYQQGNSGISQNF